MPDEHGRGAVAWEVVARETLADFEIFGVDRLRVRSPRTGDLLDRHILTVPDWVNVVAFTDDGRLLMVEQYRFGADVLSLEFPAGTLDAGEAPVDGARRELREETGYEPAALELVGDVYADPAIQDNLLHIVVARGCHPVGPPEQDHGEDVHVRIVEVGELEAMIRRGEIRHALAITAWAIARVSRSIG